MKKHLFNKAGLITALVAGATVVQVQAADMAAASGILANVAVLSVQSKADLAAAASSGDVAAINEAAKRADAVDSAMVDAQAAYAEMERATADGDDDVAAAASDDLEAALQRANDALNGAIPDAEPKSAQEAWKESQTNTGGGPSRAYDPPNIYDVPWQTQGLRSLYSSLFGAFWTSSSQGGSLDAGEGDATPE